MVALQIAMLWLALIAPAGAANPRPELPRAWRVVVAELEVMVEPSDSAYSTGNLGSGNRVEVVSEESGWTQSRAPAGTFAGINAADLHEQPAGETVVGPAPTQVRFAAERAKLPGPPARTLPPGTPVRVLDRPDLQVRGRTVIDSWRTIAVAASEARFVRSAGLQRGSARQIIAVRRSDRRVQLASYQVRGGEASLPPEVNAELASIAVMNRSVKSAPLESWELGPIKGRYEALLRRYHDDPAVQKEVQPRLDQAASDAVIASKAREVSRLLRASEQRDADVAEIRRSTDQAVASTDRKFDAQGLLQPSSRRYRGQKVLALIGPEGKPVSYLTIPPGVPINRYLARKVGVRGIVHFDEGLGTRLISVRDLELLEKVR